MTRRRLLTCAATLWTARFLPSDAVAAEDEESRLIASRRTIEASRRLAADGWRVRDGLFTTGLTADQPVYVPVHLIGGVQYLFTAACRPTEQAFTMDLLDSEGRLLADGLAVDDVRGSAVLHAPERSQRCHLRLGLRSGALPAQAAVLYVYR